MTVPTTQLTARYRVQVAGELDERWASTLDGWQIRTIASATSLERHADQGALYGLLIHLRDRGLVLLAVERLDTS
jgi:hypothetical protein